MERGGVREGVAGGARLERETEASLPWAWQCGKPVDMPGLEGKGRVLVHLLLIWFGVISNAF